MKYIDAAKRNTQHICLFGDPKSGKSTLAAKLATEGKKLVWISMDNGHGVIDKLPRAAQENVEIFIIPDTKNNPIAIHTCLSLASGGNKHICNTHSIVSCPVCAKSRPAEFSDINLFTLDPNTVVVWDNLSQLTDSAINAITIKEARKAKPPEDPDEFKFGYDEWAMLGTLMNKFLTEVQQAPYDCICISHSEMTIMEDGNKKLVPLIGTARFSRNAGKYFDAVVYCEVKNRDHKFGSSTRYSFAAMTGSRSDIEIENQKGAPSLLPFFPGKSSGMATVVAEAEETSKTQLAKVAAAEAISTEKLEEQLPAATPTPLVYSGPSAVDTANTAKALLLSRLKKG